VLDAVQSIGFTAVSTYASWARHEVALVHQRGLIAVVRVGPNTAAEQEDAGWPRRVLDDPACQARRPSGLPYLLPTATHHAYMPSYASKATLAEVAGWYDELIPRLARHQWPDGPVVAAQVDNELSYHFQAHAFALDYHPDAVEQYRAFVGDPHAQPPTDGTDGPEGRRVEWVRFKEHHLRATLATLAAMVRGRGLDRVPLLHNDYPRTTTPQDLGALEAAGAVDVAGADVYVTKEGGRFVTDLARHLAGSSQLPYLAELGTGWLTLPWLLPMRTDALDEQHTAMRAFLGGVRAANVYMLVERDRWYGSPISARGELRPKADFYRRLHRLLDALEWETLRRDVSVLLVENRDEARRSAAGAILGDLVPPLSQLLPLDRRLFDGPDDPAAAWLEAAARALVAAGVDFDRASSSALPDLSRYSHVVGWGLDGMLAPADPADVVDLVPRPAFRRDCADVDLVRLLGPGREVLALASAAAEPRDVTITFDGAVALEAVWEAESVKGDGSVTVRVPAWGVQVWEVQR
jgi:beta-galactosidase